MDVLQFIIAIAGILGAEGIFGLIFFKVTKRSKVADVVDKETDTSAKQNDQWQEIVEYLKRENGELKAENDRKNCEINECKDHYNDLTLRVVKLESRIEHLYELRCDKLACKYRIPQRKSETESKSETN